VGDAEASGLSIRTVAARPKRDTGSGELMNSTIRRVLTALCAAVLLAAGVPLRGLAQSGTGKVVGVVYDSQGGDVLRKATIEVVGVDGRTVATGVDGDYTLELPAGTYTVKYSFENFTPQAAEIVVVAGRTAEHNVVLVPVGAGESVDVVAGSDSDTITATLEQRKSMSSISDIVGREQIAEDTRSTLDGVIVRVPGVTVNDDGVAVTRGMDVRYGLQTLNGATVPTPDPERKQLSLELIPAKLLQSAAVLKSFTPDQPGEFSGGLIRLETVEVPANTTLSMSYQIGFNSVTTGKEFLTSGGGAADFFGYGAGQRGLPETVPLGERIFPSNPFTPGGFSRAQLQTIGRSFDNAFMPERIDAFPSQNFNVAAGRRWGKFAAVAAFGFKNELQTRNEVRNFFAVDSSDDLIPITNYDYTSGTVTSRLGLTGNLTYEIDGDNKIFFKNFYSNQADNEARVFEGFQNDRSTDLRNFRLRYVQEQLYSGQLSGRHALGFLGDTIAAWRYTYSRAVLDEPDLREALYELNPFVGEFTYLPQNQSLFHLFNEMRENMREPAVDLSKFWFANGITISGKIGGSFINRDRVFDSRRFIYVPRGSLAGLDLTAAPEELLAIDNIRPTNGFEISEETRSTDHYDALQNLTAGYAMLDMSWSRWRLIGGARAERSIQRVNTFEPFRLNVPTVTASLDNTDWLPSIGLVYTINPSAASWTMSVRGSFAKTVSRPQFRELSPFEFTDVTGGRSSVGNPDLVRTRIDNWDVRYEIFPSSGELLAVSFFYKDLAKPIEQVVLPGANYVTTFQNADRATNKGIELEVRKNLGFLADWLQTASVYSNYTFVSSDVTLTREQGLVVTSLERPLVLQSRHVFNTILSHEWTRWDFESRALFNYTGDRLTDVGTLGLPDIVEQGRPTLDLSFAKRFGGERRPWAVEVELENLLNRSVDFRQGSETFRVYREGREVSVGVSYSFF
jgi:outer membrane receptor protein involved in Fe transport